TKRPGTGVPAFGNVESATRLGEWSPISVSYPRRKKCIRSNWAYQQLLEAVHEICAHRCRGFHRRLTGEPYDRTRRATHAGLLATHLARRLLLQGHPRRR